MNYNHQNNNHDNDSEMYSSIHSELEQQLRILKDENKTLKENNEELTAQLLNNHLIEGKSLLKEGEAISSLASEISDLNLEQVNIQLINIHIENKCQNIKIPFVNCFFSIHFYS